MVIRWGSINAKLPKENLNIKEQDFLTDAQMDADVGKYRNGLRVSS